jgi:hypothetical protein
MPPITAFAAHRGHSKGEPFTSEETVVPALREATTSQLLRSSADAAKATVHG